ncbi:hypothetical protein HHL16_03885 [Pseudoflavitalea sp. G-6-1-2]|uniref:toprim domain-containing protein n=1 Tax=Pseudoflavitalea sp. G-6-1-2 TaxID=2728841 RepID=UPI00146D62A4|nr:toprim domain-containing protein [Pseudoflavitalea sp. G-6-1-2]NML19998.1 hypothetical protein [Pseudoflavitalea sp. G-6-1-2]
MNIEQARTIAITDVMDKLGHHPTKKNTRDVWYLSPFRAERTASFKVNLARNVWYDFGIPAGGDIIKFVRSYLESEAQSSSVSDALRWLSNLSGITPSVKPFIETGEEEEKRIVLRSVFKLRSVGLLEYLDHRGIPDELAHAYLREIRLYDNDTGRSFTAIAFKNNLGAYEYRTYQFKGCIGKKAVISIRGKNPSAEGVHLFEGFMDFLSVLVLEEKMKLDDDVIILNSAMMLKQALPLLDKSTYKYIYTWFDNDDTGKKATESIQNFCVENPPLEHTPMNESYPAYKDVNEWLIHLIS